MQSISNESNQFTSYNTKKNGNRVKLTIHHLNRSLPTTTTVICSFYYTEYCVNFSNNPVYKSVPHEVQVQIQIISIFNRDGWIRALSDVKPKAK